MAVKKGNGKSSFRDSFTSAQKAGKEMRENLELDRQQRLASDIILGADDLSGDYDFERALFTTLGGKLKRITNSDLQQLRHLKRQLGTKFKGGITAQQLINLSTELVSHKPSPYAGTSDRDRANSQIHTAFPTSSQGGKVHFQTNSGPNSKVTRHHVVFDFLNFIPAVSADVHSDKAAKLMAKGQVRVDCDCQRQRFFFRYIASSGNFNAGRHEDGLPKITNPELRGVACKHIIRVANVVLTSKAFQQFAARMIDRARQKLDDKKKIEKISDMEQFLSDLKKERAKKGARVTTTEEKKLLAAAKKALKQQTKQQKAIAKVYKDHTTKAKEKAALKIQAKKDRDAAIEVELRNTEHNLRNLPGYRLSEEAIKAELMVKKRELMK